MKRSGQLYGDDQSQALQSERFITSFVCGCIRWWYNFSTLAASCQPAELSFLSGTIGGAF